MTGITTELYLKTYYIRRAEELIAERYSDGEMRCPVHLSIGQEAAAVAFCEPLTTADKIYATHRCHAHYLAKGGDLRAMYAEIMGREDGCVGGRGGSMHLMDETVGVMASIPIVGSSIPLAVGQAFADVYKGEDNLTVAFVGDGCLEEGAWHESANFASLHKLPVLFACENNLYSVYTQYKDRQPARPLTDLAKAHGIKTFSGDGNDLSEAVALAQEAVDWIRSGNGPAFVELSTYRWLEHCGPNDDDHLGYRPTGELETWKNKDPVAAARKALLDSGQAVEGDLARLEQKLNADIERTFESALQSPMPTFETANSDDLTYAPAPVEVTLPQKTDRTISFAQAVNEAFVDCMERDENIYILGEGVQDPSSMWGTTKGLAERFGQNRTLEMPVAELALTGIAVGSAVAGLRPVMSLQRVEFSMLGLEQIFNNAAKFYYGSNGKHRVPLTMRLVVGRGWGQGPQHAQSLETMYAQFPGLKVIMPTFAADAKGMLTAAIEDDNPVVCIEHRWLHNGEAQVPEGTYRADLSGPKVVREGSDLTIVATSLMVLEAIKAAEELEKSGLSCEVIDVRVIRPLNVEPIIASVKKTGRLMTVDTGWKLFGVGGEVVSQVTEKAFSALIQAPRRLAIKDYPVPSSRGLVQGFYPDAVRIAGAAAEMLECSATGAINALIEDAAHTPIDVPDPSFKGPF